LQPPLATTGITNGCRITRWRRSREQAENDEFLGRLKAIPTDGFSEQDRLSHDLLVRVLGDNREYRDLKSYEMPVTQFFSTQTFLADLPLSVPLDSVKHYEDYIARLHQIPVALAQTEEVMRAGMRDGLMPVKFLLEKVPVSAMGLLLRIRFLADQEDAGKFLRRGQGTADKGDYGSCEY
jgi:uncharacterized protein (DUF885 family)